MGPIKWRMGVNAINEWNLTFKISRKQMKNSNSVPYMVVAKLVLY